MSIESVMPPNHLVLSSAFPPAFSLSQHYQWPRSAAISCCWQGFTRCKHPLSLNGVLLGSRVANKIFLLGKLDWCLSWHLKHSGGELGDESWSQASSPRGAVAEPRKEVNGLLANGVGQLDVPPVFMCQQAGCDVPTCQPGGVARPVSSVEGECGVLVGTHGTVWSECPLAGQVGRLL